MEKVFLTSLIYRWSLIFILHLQNRVSNIPRISIPFVFKSLPVFRLVLTVGPTCQGGGHGMGPTTFIFSPPCHPAPANRLHTPPPSLAGRCRPYSPSRPASPAFTLVHERRNFFIYLFYHDFAKIYGRSQILQKYTSSVVTHGVRDITSWSTAVGATRSGPWAWPRPGAVHHGVMGLAPWAAASGPSAVGHSVSQPASTVGHGARVWLPI
jgi:hypothetical protein